MKLKHIVKEVITIKCSQNVLELLEMMKENKISSVVVLNKAGKVYGIFTESDAIKAVALGFNLRQMQVKEFVGKQEVFSLPDETYLFEAFNRMQGQGYRHVIALDSQNRVKGIATQSDFLKYLDTQVLVKIKSVEDVMIKDVVTADENYSVNDAALIMFENKISSLIVVNKLEKPVGIVTERDMVDFALQSSHVRLHEVMSKPLLTTTKDEPLHSVLEKMEQLQIRRFVIVDSDENVIGLVTRSNILRSIQAKKIEILAKTLKEKNRELEIIKKQDEELKLLDTALKSSANAVVITDVDANIKWCNSAFEKLTGYQKEEVLGKRPKELLKSGVHSKNFYDSLWKTILAKRSFKGEVVNRKKNGELYTENLTITPLLDSKGQITHFVAVKEDITQLKKLQQSILESEKRFKNLFEQAPLPYQSLDKDGYIVEVNKAWLQMSGYNYNEVIGSHISQYICKDEQKMLKTTFSSFLLEGEVRGQVFKFLTKSGQDKIIELNGKLVKNQDKIYTHCLILDITEKKAMQDRIHFIAHNDTLTGLPNRVSLHDEIDHAIARANRNKGTAALLVVGIDSFKDINDSFGHKTGDELLILVANEMQKIAKENEFIARVAGDEFAVLIEDVQSDDDCAIAADRYINALSKMWSLGAKVTVYLNVTMGISVYPKSATNALQLFQYSDAALFLAKKENRGKYRFYNDAITAQARKNVETLAQLKEAIIKEEFVLMYQPQIALDTKKPLGVEALIRWKKDSKLISPLEFIALAEQRGLISGITEFVLKQICIDMDDFVRRFGRDFKVSFNLSAVELNDMTVEKIIAIKERYGVATHNLGIEITESIFINDIDAAVQVLQKFKDEGFLISLDDFGIGYSSLHYLKKLPVDILKIDKSFIDGLPHENDDKQITKAIISMANTLGLNVLAEGVETKEQLEFLESLACDYVQGYYFAKPMPKKELLS